MARDAVELPCTNGFLVDEPRCVRLSVTAGDQRETVEVGVGAPCEGQQPPPQPSDA